MKIKVLNSGSKLSDLCLMLFILTNTFVNYDVKYMIVSIVFLTLFYFLEGFKQEKSELVKFLLLILIILVFSIKFIHHDYSIVASEYKSFNISMMIRFFILATIFFSCRKLFSADTERMFKIIGMILKLNIFLAFSQVVIYTVSGFYLDAYYLFNGDVSRYTSDVFSSSSIFRVTGFYQEPSTLGAAIVALLCLYLKLNNWNVDKLALFSLFLCFMTMSTAIAIIAFLLYVCMFLFNSNIKNIVIYMFVIAVSSIAILNTDMFEDQVNKFESRIGMRTGLIDIIEQREDDIKLFGPGPYGFEQEIYNETFGGASNVRLASVNDAGSLVFLVIHFGQVGVLIFIVMLAIVKGLRSKILFLILSMTKISIFHPLVLLVFACYTVTCKNRS